MNSQFKPLPIGEAPVQAKYNANRFRIYFAPYDLNYNPVQFDQVYVARFTRTCAEELLRNFPRYFSGREELSNMTRNDAVVRWDEQHPYIGKHTLRFTLDFRVLRGKLNVPDAHSDWVGLVWQHDQGFAVQTLRRLFEDREDWKLYSMTVLALELANEVGSFGGEFERPIKYDPHQLFGKLKSINSDHFLAGRRSWVFGHIKRLARVNRWIEMASTINGKKSLAWAGQTNTSVVTPIFFFETAAIERYSSWLYLLAHELGEDKDLHGIFMNEMRPAVIKIWSVLLTNFVQHFGFKIVDIEPESGWKIGDYAGVHYITGEFGEESDCLTASWVKELLKLHPGVADQFTKSSVTPVKPQENPSTAR